MNNNNLVFLLMLIIASITSCNEDDNVPLGDFIPIPSGDIVLAAELDLPPGDGPHPVLIMGYGSGRLDRSLYAGAARNYLGIGIAVLRYDKRGVGQSTGRFLDVNAANSPEIFPILADDMVSIAEFLASHRDIDPERIGLLGPSQSGWIMPLAAISSPHISCIVSVSGATSAVGISDYYDSIAEGELSEEEIEAALESYNGVEGFDPRTSLEALNIPALWVYGGKDKSNPTNNDIAILEEIMIDFDKDFTIHLFPNLNHELIDVTSNQTIPDTQFCVNDWLKEKL